MAKKKTGKAAIPNWKKKKWYELIAPAIYGDKVIGEAFVESPEKLIGKVVSTNLMTLMGNPRRQNFSVKLRVEKVQGKNGITKPIKLEMLNSSVRRLIRAGKNRVDLSFTAITKDDVKLRYKPLILTKNKAPNSTLSDIRLKTQEFITEFSAQNGFEAVFDAATRTTLQKDLKAALEKVYPVKMVEIRVLEVELAKGERKLNLVDSNLDEVIVHEDSSDAEESDSDAEDSDTEDNDESEDEKDE